MYEYKSTVGRFGSYFSCPDEVFAEDPSPPDKDECWELMGTAIADGIIVWTWRRLTGSPMGAVPIAASLHASHK